MMIRLNQLSGGITDDLRYIKCQIKYMSYDEKLANRIREALTHLSNVKEQQKMGEYLLW